MMYFSIPAEAKSTLYSGLLILTGRLFKTILASKNWKKITVFPTYLDVFFLNSF